MWDWGISVKTTPGEISISALFPPRRPLLCRGKAGEGKKKARGRRPRALATFSLSIPSGSRCGWERSVRQKRRGNDHTTLFIQVRIDLVARLIITLTFKSEGEIPWCYPRSNQNSLVKRLDSTTYFFHFAKRNLKFRVNFISATISCIRSERVKILKSRKVPVRIALPYFLTVKEKHHLTISDAIQ